MRKYRGVPRYPVGSKALESFAECPDESARQVILVFNVSGAKIAHDSVSNVCGLVGRYPHYGFERHFKPLAAVARQTNRCFAEHMVGSVNCPPKLGRQIANFYRLLEQS